MSKFQIIDSHIHLFPKSHLETLSWHSQANPLGAQHSVSEYRQAISPQVRGFIFLETDRISSLSPSDWNHALDEVSFLTRIALGTPVPGEGHNPEDKHLCLGIVPWAPVPAGADAVAQYLDLVRERSGDAWKAVKGVRYLVQDKAAGTMVEDGFVDALRHLRRQGMTFDLGVDARSGGLGQLREAVEMMKRVNDEGDGVTIVINHMCKPNLRLDDVDVRSNPEFLEWKDLIEELARAPHTYMKLSGAFSELLPLGDEVDIAKIADCVRPWTDVVFDAFGAERVMFGSDWPVCNVGGGGNDVSWGRWKSVVEKVLEQRGLSEDEKRGVWGGVALRAYGIEI
ncbi:Amidohydrolase 2 [Penicillium brevicompactum]|uniref:Amidohydrolase 2 n=1 Tax=Penicillium brevicompactum TaxID=5074 RepID=A0A9W9QVI8_PENBR|nr:Amidohydrolase 2 [Penicillium brevicompactum]